MDTFYKIPINIYAINEVLCHYTINFTPKLNTLFTFIVRKVGKH